MVALSMADGYARLTNKPQCVIVHVDVGTQGLGAAVHNASCGRAPVLIFAGLSPYTIEGELCGSRTEYIHWIQDVPDQRAIVAQYCRYTGEIKTGKNVKQIVHRALQWATSDPKGPAYLVGAREPMEQELDPYQVVQEQWQPVQPSALLEADVAVIAEALAAADEPLVITGYAGRNHAAVAELVKLADTIKGLRVLDTGGCDMCFPANHPAWLGVKFGVDDSIRTADVILVIDCDVPWINTQCHPKLTARIFHIDVDPLKQQMPVFYIAALSRHRSDSHSALRQLNAYIASNEGLLERLSTTTTTTTSSIATRWEALKKSHADRLSRIAALAVPKDPASPSTSTFNASILAAKIRAAVPRDTIFTIEAVTNTILVADQIQATIPGTWINCGGGGLGWSGGGTLGVKLAADTELGGRFVCNIVGDGTFLFSVPASVFWISQRYKIPVLTIVLNNKGWHAPRRSALLVHPQGYVSNATDEELNISFAPSPDYAGIAKAAAGGNLWAERAKTVQDLDSLLPEAIKAVQSGVGAVIDAYLQ
ncbi:MAG: hypothetical protein M1825_005597 [Sarcosagium campestre]|nr:MAG: hypothetical protein M1825_005597 [Sarcosagium campestre]